MTSRDEFNEFIDGLYRRYAQSSRTASGDWYETKSGIRVVQLANEDIALKYLYKPGFAGARYVVTLLGEPVVGFSGLKRSRSGVDCDSFWYKHDKMVFTSVEPEFENELYQYGKELMMWAQADYYFMQAAEDILGWCVLRKFPSREKYDKLAGKKLV